MKVYSQLESAQIENLATDPTNLPEGRIWKNTTTNEIKAVVNGVVQVLTLNAATQTLINKTLTSPTINSPTIATPTVTGGTFTSPNITTPTGLAKADVGLGNVDNTSDATKNAAAVTLTNKTLTSPVLTTPSVDIETYIDQSSTPANPGAGKRKLYSKLSGKFYQLDQFGVEREVGSGGGGGVNFVVGGDGEGNPIFTTYKDVAGSAPVDGIGGSPTIINISTTATAPLSGSNSFTVNHLAGTNYQGEGWYYNFTIDNASKAKVLKIDFDYIVDSGTFQAGSAGVDSDVVVYIYDVTNATLIQPSSYKLLSNSTTIADHFSATFQTASNSTSYRLILHSATPSTAAFQLKMDSLSISPSQYVFGTPITDWTAYTPTLSDSTNTTVTSSQYRRVGDSIELRGFITWSGAGGGAGFTVSLPSGLSINTTKLSTSIQNNLIGTSEWLDNGTARKFVGVTYNTATAFAFEELTSSAGALNGSGFAAGDALSYFVQVPILGWSSSVQMSDSADTRVISWNGSQSSQAVTANVTDIAFTTINDRAGSWNGTQFVVRTPGDYLVAGSAAIAASGITPQVYLNGIFYTNSYFSSSTSAGVNVSGSILVTNCKSGDLISLRANVSTTVTLGNLSILRLSGPSAIAATETMSLRYCSSAAQSLPSGNTTLSFATKSHDTHGIWNGTTFTCQSAGKYSIKAVTSSAAPNSGLSGNVLRILKNGTAVSEIYYTNSYTNTANYCYTIADDLDLIANDTITFQFFNGFGATITAIANVNNNYMSISKTGRSN